MTIWDRTKAQALDKLLKDSRKIGQCVLLREEEDGYFDDPMSEFAPVECSELVRVNHEKTCDICKTLKEEE